MRIWLFLYLCLAAGRGWAQYYNPVENLIQKHLDQIRPQRAALRAFFHRMPKGGDIHHHYSGAVFAEEYARHLEERGFWVNLQDYSIEQQRPKGSSILRDTAWQSIADLQTSGKWWGIRQRLVERWSVLGYDGRSPSDQYFFSVFPAFAPAVSADYLDGLRRIKARALGERLRYIETIFEVIQCNETWEELQPFEQQLLALQARRDTAATQALLGRIFKQMQSQHAAALLCVSEHNSFVERLHKAADIDSDDFTMRYQNYVLRMLPPTDVFGQLYLAFASANSSPLIVGVNLVGPENDATALRDCWLHHQFFKFFHHQYPNVGIALHAGELTTRTAAPEHLTWHISDALLNGHAQRIGHCFSLPYEQDFFGLLRRMANQKIVAEINLSSNAFILANQPDEHPLPLLIEAGVPVVIATDDPGILRISITDEYARLAHEYPQISYRDIKKIAFNSIEFSFIKDPELKKKLLSDLEKQFQDFEQLMLKEISSKS